MPRVFSQETVGNPERSAEGKVWLRLVLLRHQAGAAFAPVLRTRTQGFSPLVFVRALATSSVAPLAMHST